MSDAFYLIVRELGRFPFWVSSHPRVYGLEHIPARGPYLIAATHQSPFDIPLIMRHIKPPVDFVSTTEVFSHRLLGWFYGHLNAFPLERSRADPATVRVILDRLSRGRVVAMFPEGRLRTGDDSVLHNGSIRSGIGRIASLANVPVLPCVILNSGAYGRRGAWRPVRGVRYTIAFAEVLQPQMEPKDLENRLVAALRNAARSVSQPFMLPIDQPPHSV